MRPAFPSTGQETGLIKRTLIEAAGSAVRWAGCPRNGRDFVLTDHFVPEYEGAMVWAERGIVSFFFIN